MRPRILSAQPFLAHRNPGQQGSCVKIGSRSGQQGEREGRTRPPAILIFQRWAINTLAVLVATHVVSGIHYDTVTSLFVASLLFGILTTFLRPLLFVLTLPLVVLTLGLFVFVINAGLLYLVGSLVKDFRVDGFWPAFWGAIVIGLISVVLNSLTGSGDGKLRVRRSPPASKPSGNDGNGPVIDV